MTHAWRGATQNGRLFFFFEQKKVNTQNGRLFFFLKKKKSRPKTAGFFIMDIHHRKKFVNSFEILSSNYQKSFE